MAAGSVISEPASGTRVMMTKKRDSSRSAGSRRDTWSTIRRTSSMMGRLAATTMMTKTKAGSVKLRVSRYSTAPFTPRVSPIHTNSAQAQTPNTASTSDSRCHSPACGPPLLARRAKTGTEKVWMMAMANRMLATTSV